ncbi:SDR family NAD(P)-dependent oxidoreductase [Microbacterium sediminis]|uniref:Alcohol dehydrogenase n=1 Tax=Microbacterium sediminis TaxID=904291 RepID=A0A1B9N9P8_9MICO|nr:SDR family NAD(P)-dependent oxidoreductase [Microbacterium sediminis]OCG73300.1 alcohol dehydrogenase [Microbacterium sediminis]QBR75193.1 SDR family NAD(P)-dependent oxidoreductase [Microbacterium sediminis]
MSAVSGRRVLLAGGTSEAGWAAARRLREAGAHAIVAGRSADKLAAFADEGFDTFAMDLTDEAAVDRLATDLREIDGVLHLVGGWRGGGGIPGQTDADWAVLESSLTAWRHVSRALWPQLIASPAARLAVVSSTAVARPLAGGANYAAVKAAAEAWTRALAHGFAKHSRDAQAEQTGAATIFRVTQLAGLEDRLATEFAALWDRPATEVNDAVIDLR